MCNIVFVPREILSLEAHPFYLVIEYTMYTVDLLTKPSNKLLFPS